MNGWGEVFMIVTANGDVLPCHAARVLPNSDFPDVKNDQLSESWYDSAACNKYRGDEWIKEPCRSCSEKENDFTNNIRPRRVLGTDLLIARNG